MFEGLGNMMSGAGGYIQQNPEQFAIMADMLGQNLAPDNAFAGIGGMMGRSSLANKAKQEQQQMLSALLSGNKLAAQPTQSPQSGLNMLSQGQAQPATLSSQLGDMNFLTAAPQTGPTGISYTQNLMAV